MHCDLDPDLIAVFEGVGNGLRNAVDSHWHAINSRVDHALCQRISGKADEPKWETLHTGLSRLAIDCHPDHIRVRVHDPMKPECSFETDNPVGNTFAGEHDPMFQVGGDGLMLDTLLDQLS
jgi:hypothetical protein